MPSASSPVPSNAPTNPDAMIPTVVTDFVFDLFDSVTLSQKPEEQQHLYEHVFPDLSKSYFGSQQSWPSVQAMASECNGNPLFLALYRELAHRQQQYNRPTVRDRIEGFHVYKELFDEIILEHQEEYFLLPTWCFDILNEFLYQFQGYCQIRSAVQNNARKQGLLNDDGTINETASNANSNLMENLMAIQNNADAWDVESVYSYLNRLVAMGTPTTSTDTEPTQTPVQTYLSIFASITLSRLDCLLCDYTGCLEALVPLDTHGLVVVPKEKFNLTVTQVIHSVLSARLSLVYHAGIAKIMLRRYKDAIRTLGELCAYLQVNYFRAGGGSRKGGDHQQQQWMKQYDRMLSLLAILIRICPNNHGLNESVVKAVRDKFSATTAAAGPKDLFACPKFIAIQEHQQDGMMQQQIQQFHQEMELVIDNKLPFYLKLYTSLPMSKLGETDDVSAQLLSYKARMHPRDRDGSVHSSDAALDVHYYVTADSVVHVSADSSRERRLEPWYCANIQHVRAIGRDAAAIRTTV